MTVVRMGIRRRSAPGGPDAGVKSRHVIERYSISESSIWCECGWLGPEDTFQEHRKEMGVMKSQRRKNPEVGGS